MTSAARLLSLSHARSFVRFCCSNMHVLTLPALSDNYMYLLIDEKSMQCAVVDPVDPSSVLTEVNKRGLKLSSVLTTHHHWDHAGGNSKLIKALQSPIPVYGGSGRVEAVTKQVEHGDTITVGTGIKVTCLKTPCHTKDHICYYACEDGQSDGCVFTGDTLFLGGCGRFFEGNAEQMYHALLEVIGKLPASTKVYCGHEYTVKNLDFAKTVDPDNVALLDRINVCAKLRSDGQPTVPGTVAEELATNPFMRVTDEALQARVGASGAIDAMAIIRRKKDAF
ncbi:unnamed protein product [Mesocestoides corti]|uniref:hydroxyacylglutathione hydrolase n=2 Tax=Mesocestoides corti TaxID=53468 RepID=A0A0R3U7D8_MESCO|nr:unnamed protein product [Mesocestoides corti]